MEEFEVEVDYERIERIWRAFLTDEKIEECETEELPLAV